MKRTPIIRHLNNLDITLINALRKISCYFDDLFIYKEIKYHHNDTNYFYLI